MAGARDYMRTTILKRKQQARRNLEAMEEEAARAAEIPRTHYSPDPNAERKMQVGGYENKAVEPAYFPDDDDEAEDLETFDDLAADPEPEPEDEPGEVGLSVPFSSSAAQVLAESESMTDEDFDDEEPSGAKGYTVSDVRAIVKDRASDQ